MIDAVVYIANITEISEDKEVQLPPPYAAAENSFLHYVRVTQSELDALTAHYTVLAQMPYTGPGTAERVYQQIQDDPEKLALYESVYDTAPREVDDGEGGTITITPPFKFGMLAESVLPAPETVSSRQGMQQLIIAGLDELVESAIEGISDVTQRKLTQAWFLRATEWERDNPQFIGLMHELGLTDQQADDHMRAAALL